MKKLEQTDVYPFQCYLCISSFKKEGFLKKHISQFHEDQNPEPCPICSHVFMNGQQGGFQLEFVSIRRVINHITCYRFESSHWLKLQHSDWRVKSLTSEAIPSATQFFMRAYKISHFPGL